MSDHYLHIADDGGIFVAPPEERYAAWVTLSELLRGLRRLSEFAQRHPVRILLSTQRGSRIATPAIQAVQLSGLPTTEVAEGPEVRRTGGSTALIAAASVGATHLVADLLQRGEDPDQSDDDGRTPLMHAALHGQVNTLDWIVVAGADLEQRDDNGDTALTLAAGANAPAGANALTGANRLTVVKRLLGYGANFAAFNYQGLDAHDVAASRNHREVAALLPKGPSLIPGAGVSRFRV